jgi:hypothetical protein
MATDGDSPSFYHSLPGTITEALGRNRTMSDPQIDRMMASLPSTLTGILERLFTPVALIQPSGALNDNSDVLDQFERASS